MDPLQPDPEGDTRAEVMRLHYLEGLSIRFIAKRLGLSRKTVRKHLGRVEAAPVVQKASRPSLLDSCVLPVSVHELSRGRG
jgi:transposase